MKSGPFSKRSSVVFPLLIAVFILAGCNLPSNTPVPPTVIPTAAASPTAIQPAETATAIPPTLTVVPIATPSPRPDLLVFATGATAGVASGSLAAGEIRSFTFSASTNQPLILILNSPKGDLFLGVTDPDGAILLDPAKKWSRLQWLLPKTGTYTIQVSGAASPEDYTLTVKIAAPVSFASGSDTATLSGKTVNGLIVSYSVFCTAGQTMNASLNVPATTAYLDVFGIAYGTLLSATTKASTWTGVLPSTENYVIEVIPTNGTEVDYKLTVKCH
jgi:hypothetical protein